MDENSVEPLAYYLFNLTQPDRTKSQIHKGIKQSLERITVALETGDLNELFLWEVDVVKLLKKERT